MKNVIFEASVIEEIKNFSKDSPKLVKKIFELIADIQDTPFTGIGKPEPLKYQFKGCWSRRINDEHRLIYEISTDGIIKILSVHGHYED